MTAYYQQSRTASEPVLSYSQMVSAIEAGNVTPNVIQAYEYYMGTPWTNGTAALYQKSTGKSSGGGGGGNDTSMTLTTAKAMAEAGQFTDAVLDTFYKAGYNDAYLKVTYGYDPGKGQPDAQEAGYNDAYFRQAMNSLSTLLAQGKGNAAVSGLDSIWSKLSKAQKQQAQTLLNGYGYTYYE